MHLKAIEMEGFKSYGRPTRIGDFHKQFNAITGLNGSGKSNILDAICFVLGIARAADVRADSLKDVIFKQGNAAGSSACVNLIFDNSIKELSPPGLATESEVIVTRSITQGTDSRFLINGSATQQNKVKELFCSVQLNVNNPHFLVMQGRITKVLNMKPKEILSMIEEASGTSMFEKKKSDGERILEQKDQKLIQIDTYINNNISPKLEKLKDERASYLEFKNVERELEHIEKFAIAWRYVNSIAHGDKCNENALALINQINSTQEKIAKLREEIPKFDLEIENMRKRADYDSGLSDVEKRVGEKTTHLIETNGALKQNADNIGYERKLIADLEKIISDDEKMLKGKKKTMEKIEGTFQRLADEEEQDKRDLEKAKQTFQALSAGFVVDEAGNEATLQDQLMAAQKAIADANIELETIKRMKPHCESELKLKKGEFSMLSAAFKKDTSAKSKIENEIDLLRNKMATYDALREEERAINAEATQLRRARDTFEQRDGRLSFRYQDPEPGFSRKSVHGLVCRLIEVADPKFSTAVEKTAGARLFNVVVDTDATSRKLLKNGKLERRTTIIPLNQISGHRLTARVIEAAQRVAGANNVWPALTLIRYNNTLQPAMEYIFGSTLICRDIVTAKKVCYHPDVRARCVTLDGDTCDPSGTLTGGAQERTQPILPMLQELRAILKNLDEKDLRLGEIERELTKLSQNMDKQMLKTKLAKLEDDLNVVINRQQHALQLQTEITSLEQEITTFEQRFIDCKEIISKQESAVKEIQGRNEKADRENSIKNAERDIQRLKKKSAESKAVVLLRREEYEALKLELREMESAIQINHDQIDVHQSKIQQLQEEAVTLTAKVSEVNGELDILKSQLKDAKDLMSAKNKEISIALCQRDKLSKEITEHEFKMKLIQKDHDKCKAESVSCKNRAAELRKTNDWIVHEEQYFGKPNGAYDFTNANIPETEQRLTHLRETKEKLSRTLNTKAMLTLSKIEEEYEELMRKRNQIEVDKMNILAVIDDLTKKKRASLEVAWKHVNVDFGSIFETLLPGAQARLEQTDPKSLLKGLDIKVGFGNTWKEGLLELSGGQRSLVALSLILAMLRFKPAPIYILDEVDAALDSSHTENIGAMLKKHFKTSQFIVVSLKEGMFKNANVLFRTQCINGVSSVTQHVADYE